MLHQIASQIGQTENDGGAISHAVIGYLAAAGIPSGSVVASWSGALLAWSAIKSGIVPPVNANEPLQWLTWGSALVGPQPGSIVILTEGGGRTAFLCGVAARVQARKVYVIGCFDRIVQTRAFPIEQVIGARRIPGTQPMQSVQITIEHDASEVAPMQAPVVMPPPVFSAPMMITAEPAHTVEVPQSVTPADAVGMQHLEALLALVQEKFRDVETRIETVQNHAIGSIQINEVANQ